MAELKDDPDVKKLIDAALKQAGSEEAERTKDLTAKHTSLLNEIKHAKIKYNELDLKFKDIDPDRFAELEKMAKELKNKQSQKNVDDNDAAAVKEEYETRIADMLKVHNTETDALKAENSELKSSYIGKTSRETVLEALAKRKVSPKAMLNNILPLVETTVEGENWNTIIKNSDGTPRVDTATQKPFTLDNLLDEMALDPDLAANFPQASGSGVDEHSGTPVNLGGVTKYSDLKTFEDKKAYLDKHGQEAVTKLINAGQ